MERVNVVELVRMIVIQGAKEAALYTSSFNRGVFKAEASHILSMSTERPFTILGARLAAKMRGKIIPRVPE
jgi:hypothetical protein